MIQRNEVHLHNNWQKELTNVVTDPKELMQALEIDSFFGEKDATARQLFPMRVPRPFIAKMRKGDPNDPLLRQVLPLHVEFLQKAGYVKDPLAEQESAIPGLLHKYQSRVLVLLKTGCAVNCRYCFRRHFPYQDNQINKQGLKNALKYINSDSKINEVILSGGDPLMAKDDLIDWFMTQIEQIAHVKRLRIHSRLPVVIPSRITDTLCARFSTSRLKVVFVHHINHPNEVDEIFKAAAQRLKAAQVTQLNQAVLLKGINDSVGCLAELSEALFDADILPYYLHLLDKVEGASHFDMEEKEARLLMAELLETLPGFLVPKLVREIGGKRSKTPIDLQLQ
ncbi:EF-P beta-lysylation protein EpmB [Pseudoalteromonas xiamenensis]|uniref:EF-P beta-lysylation protein EpmB n=1 Tax=Pseudoalteromonas xiamenensis TaxID=882626 RepID=UPI0027E46410|nr:EF-P beta-lysylation protein EpmB [Pseudoalteromonas xiamenensis]WMN58411.1 EF-P beta-lysylation protein EpmB [Pseudoalteromonas xiamenensis]